MAYTVTFGNGGRPAKYREYEIDSPDDLTVIGSDADAGSIAHSRSNNTTYKLGNNREWYALTEGGGGGGGGESPLFVMFFVQDVGNRYKTTVTWNELREAILAKKIIFPIGDATMDAENVGYGYGGPVSIGTWIEEGKWKIYGSFIHDGSNFAIEGGEDNANDPVTATMQLS